MLVVAVLPPDADVEFLLECSIHNLEDSEKRKFEGSSTVHLVSIWKLTQSLETPLAKMTAKLSTTRTNGVNHCKKETSYPVKSALYVGAMAMLPKKYVVEAPLNEWVNWYCSRNCL